MRIVFFGDSITDAGRDKNVDTYAGSFGYGYVRDIAGKLLFENPDDYNIYNRGISGNRVVDLYARVKKDLWNIEPDYVSILVGVNDVWHELYQNGVEIDRYEKMYDMLIKDTQQRLPNSKIIICEPFITRGTVVDENIELFSKVYDYAAICKKLANENKCYFLSLQEGFNDLTKKNASFYTIDGVHPNTAGARFIAEKWVDMFKKIK